MSSFDSVTATPAAPLRSEPRAAQALPPTGGRELLDHMRRLVETAGAGPELLGRLSDDDVVGLAAAAVALTRAGEALAVAATVEAVDRGVVADSVNPDTTQWVRALGMGVEPQQARRIAEVAEKIAARTGLVRQGPPITAVGTDLDGHGDGGGPVAQLVEADPSGRLLLAEVVATGAVNVRAAHRALKETPRVERLIPSASTAEVLSWFLALGDEATDRDRRALTRQLVARFDPDQLCREEATEQSREYFTMYDLPCGMVRLMADLSKGHAAVLKHAIGKLSAPQPGSRDAEVKAGAPDRDERSAGKRRADALVELINQGAAHLPGAPSGSVTGNAKVVVTVSLENLLDRLGRGKIPGGGSTPLGDLLDVTTVRRIACAAGIIPAVFGQQGEPLDVGREQRLFTGRLRTAVVLRDLGCTFPGCDRPPDWCQVHHLIPWWSGGPTTRDNGALLCERHHTVVHRDGLTGQVTDDRVVWDLTPGLLQQWPRDG